MTTHISNSIATLAVIGNHLPRQCGIATYTADLCAAIAQASPASSVFALAMNDRAEGYAYPERVRFTIDADNLGTYHRAAEGINLSNADVVCVQHEYGIFGGTAGDNLLALLRDLRAPVVTTLHTILREPTPDQRRVLIALAELSDRVIVMSERGAAMLRAIYHVPAAKIDLIPHGIPDMPFLDPSFHKDQFGVEGKQVLLTFGLLSRNKGIEHVIAAMPAILARHPNATYIVLGTTHPHVRDHEGEAYRSELQQLARTCGVAEQVRFYDQFVTTAALIEFIGAADIYITPYLNAAQIVSGTLAYTVGAGKAVISTPYWHAEELLADGRGILVPFADSAAIAAQVCALLDNEIDRHAMRKRAYVLGRTMIWPEVARRYLESFERARNEHRLSERVRQRRLPRPAGELPPLELAQLRRLSDSTGMLQHAVMAVPNLTEGYTTDDNARALIAAVKLEEHALPEVAELATRYMAFLWHAFNPAVGRFRNFMAYDRRWLEEVGSEDSHARALWALGTVLGRSDSPALVGVAGPLFARALPAAATWTHPRPAALALFGLHAYMQRFAGDRSAAQACATLATGLLARYHEHQHEGWRWFAPELTYDNAVLPHALLLSGEVLDRADMRAAALEALAWLSTRQQAEAGHFAPVGCHGFARRDGPAARFDQQPLEAQAVVLASLDAWRLSGHAGWMVEARRAFDWFLGHNDLGLALYDPATGGCRDGLLTDRVNQNQGAESTLAYLIARLEIQRAIELQGAVLITDTRAAERRSTPALRTGRAQTGQR